MTRFARAKGSKSSNEKVPEDATPWSQLKRGMLTKQESLSEETKKCVSALKSKAQEEKVTEWVSFDEENEDSLNILKKHLKERKKGEADVNCDNELSIAKDKLNCKEKKRKGTENVECQVKKKKKKRDNCQDVSAVTAENLNKKKISMKKEKQVATEDINSKSEELTKNDVDVKSSVAAGKKKKKKNVVFETSNNAEANVDEVKEKNGKNKRKSSQILVNSFEENGQEAEKSSKKKKMKPFAGKNHLEKYLKTTHNSQTNNTNQSKNSKPDKKKLNSDNVTINIGGEMVDLVKFQGFYITKEDGERLKRLRKKMVAEGIPEDQIVGAIKLERRRCEKALSRMKKNVCFQCRKPGHLLSQCPEVQNNVDTSTGVCYKCGSTEHKAFTCKVTQGKNYPFAECFICKEKGHIARECPDNPRGLYPKGGCCKLCGDVTHLKKDCPKRISETEEKAVKLNLRDDRNVEGLDEENIRVEAGKQRKQKKPVRF